MRCFVYNASPSRVIFGSGTLSQLRDEIERLAITRAIVLSTPEQAAAAVRVLDLLGERGVGVFTEARMHTPVDVTLRAMSETGRLGADGIVSIGGGSTTGLGKAIAMRTGLKHLSIPTTYAGSAATPVLGETENGKKTTRSHPSILPNAILYDVELTLSLPLQMAVTSGFNAIAHAAEALYAQDANPVIDLIASEGIARTVAALPRLAENGADLDSRTDMLFGAWLCGTCLGAVGMSLHHKLCHTLGGMFDLPHAQMHTALLPHTLGYNRWAAASAFAQLSDATGMADVPGGLFALASKLGAAMSLEQLGMPRDGIDAAAREAMMKPYWNPRSVTEAGITAILSAAGRGLSPTN